MLSTDVAINIGIEGDQAMLIIKEGMVIPGDGTTVLEGATVYIEGDRIVEVKEGDPGRVSEGDTVINAQGHIVIPGMINAHAHGVGFGPLFPSAASALTREHVLKNLDRHLHFGTTSVIDGDGFALPQEVHEANKAHPVNVFLATTHMPVNKDAARAVDGKGLTPAHEAMTAEKAVTAGAILFGEIGGGMTLGGGGQDYLYIPMAVKKATGIELDLKQARKLKESVLSRHIRADAYRRENVEAVLEELGLVGKLSPEEARDLVQDTVLPCFQIALDGFSEAADYAERFGLPTLVHNSAPSSDTTHAIAKRLGPLLIAGHTNHTTFTPEESVESGRVLRRHGAIVEVCILDTFGQKRLTPRNPKHIYALLQADLVDTLGTDYAGAVRDGVPHGFWDGILFGIQHMVADGIVSLPKAIAMGSRNVARAVSGVGERGELVSGKIADVVVAPKKEVANVYAVIVGGRLAYRNGRVLFGETAQIQ